MRIILSNIKPNYSINYAQPAIYPNFKGGLQQKVLCEEPSRLKTGLIGFIKRKFKEYSYRKNKLSPRQIILCEKNQDFEKQLKIFKTKLDKYGFCPFQQFMIGKYVDEKNIEAKSRIVDALKSAGRYEDSHIVFITNDTNENNIELAENIIRDENFAVWNIYKILEKTTAWNLELAKQLCSDERFSHDEMAREGIIKILELTQNLYNTSPFLIKAYSEDVKLEVAKRLCKDKILPIYSIIEIIKSINNQNITLFNRLYQNKDFPQDKIPKCISAVHAENIDLAEKLCFDKDFPKDEIYDIMLHSRGVAHPVAEILCADKDFPPTCITSILRHTNEKNLEQVKNLCLNYKKMEILPTQIILFDLEEKLKPERVSKANKMLGKDFTSKLWTRDLSVVCDFLDIKDAKNISEFTIAAKKSVLRCLMKCNEGMFEISKEIQEKFPLIPTSRKDYCKLFAKIVSSMGMETVPLDTVQIKSFNKSIERLGNVLSKTGDSEFAELNIEQEFSREDFINKVVEKTKGLSRLEKQKVFDYYGFEIHHNKNNSTGYTITGYPNNTKHSEKLKNIKSQSTKDVIKCLEEDVSRFIDNNKIKCNNSEIENCLNDVTRYLPELRTIIGKSQHGSHEFDVMKHSLKVLQKIVQDSNYTKLNESDKKIMHLAALLHDITKAEGERDSLHPKESSFDSFYIAKKFNLTHDEQIKLYTLIKHHEWLAYINSSKNESELARRLKSTEYDLRHDNIFDLSLMFAHADLKAVKKDNSFHDKTAGMSRTDFNGITRSFGEAADYYAKMMRPYIEQLKTTQPLLPVTKMPSASRVKEAVSKINSDGSTDIKGVYIDKDGLVIIKFNEVNEWEKIGFPAGSKSKGINAKGYDDSGSEYDIDTGNIKFFVHGLDYEYQLVRFDAFSLPDSEALLSLSYAERPESKYKFFRAQGVILDVPTKYIHGGGNTDRGSGCHKTVRDFKKDYIFGGVRESDRFYISNLIKKYTGKNDKEYINLVQKYENKSMSEIKPISLQEKIVKAFATINSNKRKGERQYNEMYGSNPSSIMGVFIRDWKGLGKNMSPVEVVNSFKLPSIEHGNSKFLKNYALERNIPMYILGE